MLLTFGKNHQNTWIHIDEVTSGKTDLKCPYCDSKLIARKGEINGHHFAHAGETCHISIEVIKETLLPTIDSFELLDPSEKKYLERRQKYQHENIYRWSGMTAAIDHLVAMEIISVESNQDDNLKQAIDNLSKFDPSLIVNGKPTPKLKELFGTLKPLTDIQYIWDRGTKISKTSISRRYHQNKLEKQKDIHGLNRAQQYWFDAYIKRQQLVAPEAMEFIENKFKSLNQQSLYVFRFSGKFDSGLPSTFLKIGITSRTAQKRLAEVLTMLKTYGQEISGEVLAFRLNAGRLEKLIHYFYRGHFQPVGNHQEFFKTNIEQELLKQISELELMPYTPSLLPTGNKVKGKGGRRKKTTQEILAEYPDIVRQLKTDGGIRKAARITNHSVNTVQKVKTAMRHGEIATKS